MKYTINLPDGLSPEKAKEMIEAIEQRLREEAEEVSSGVGGEDTSSLDRLEARKKLVQWCREHKVAISEIPSREERNAR